MKKLTMPRVPEGADLPLGLSYKLFGNEHYKVFKLMFRDDRFYASLKFDEDDVTVEYWDRIAEEESTEQCDFLQDLLVLCRRYGVINV